jgi:hypothetical protein
MHQDLQWEPYYYRGKLMEKASHSILLSNLNTAEHNYDISDLELLVTIRALDHWRPFICKTGWVPKGIQSIQSG